VGKGTRPPLEKLPTLKILALARHNNFSRGDKGGLEQRKTKKRADRAGRVSAESSSQVRQLLRGRGLHHTVREGATKIAYIEQNALERDVREIADQNAIVINKSRKAIRKKVSARGRHRGPGEGY